MRNRFESRERLCDGIGFNPAGGPGSVNNVKGADPSVKLGSTTEAKALEAIKGFEAVSQNLNQGTFAAIGAAGFATGSIG